jgi:CheY-like chemotaxis protein
MSLRILIVDDEYSIQRLLKVCLEYLGCTADTAGNGKEAIAKLADATYQGVLLDFVLPGMDGLTVLRQIRRSHPALPVVIMTGHPASDVVRPALESGAQACLLKPFDISEIEHIVQDWTGPARTAA